MSPVRSAFRRNILLFLLAEVVLLVLIASQVIWQPRQLAQLSDTMVGAGASAIRIKPDLQELTVGTPFTFSLVLDTGQSAISGYDIAYALSNLQVLRISADTTVFPEIIFLPGVTDTPGRASAARFDGGFAGADGSLVTVTVSCLAAGPAAFTLQAAGAEAIRYVDIENDLRAVQQLSFTCVPPDTTPPAISAVTVKPGIDTAVIAWQTSEPAVSTVAYGLTSAYGSQTPPTPLQTSHTVQLAGLSPNTIYYFTLTSTDPGGNAGTYAGSFRTQKKSGPGASKTRR